ncbi:MAG TPA: polysaccharide deacetylase family protein [Myxococcota bacterium]|nr:polysaccharide deacetylase family protein [Myxococcota bacterium]
MSVLERLGLDPGERVVVVHVDDLGMSHAANQGGLSALDAAATCGSIMVPCPAFDEIAQIAKARPELDLGVHLTLNCEYSGYRWGPVSADTPSLCARDGGMWQTSRETVENATAEDVEREMRAQVERALAAGIDVTHVDAHMGTAFNLKFVDCYFRVAQAYRLPAFVPRVRARDLPAHGLPDALKDYVRRIDEHEAAGFPIFDHFDADSLEFPPGTGLTHNQARLERLGSGLSYLITHCAQGGPELESITRDWRQRDEERRIYSDGSMRDALAARGMRTLGMRPLRDLMRPAKASR